MHVSIRTSSIVLLVAITGCSPHPGGTRASAISSHLVVTNEEDVRSRLGHYARVLLKQRRFDEIEAVADSLRRSGACWPSGAFKFISFAQRGFNEVDDPTNAQQWQEQLANLRAWTDARPQSALASIALAEALDGRGWAARGHGYANTVSRSEWERMGSDLDEAESILRQCPPQARDNPLWYEAMLGIEHGSGQDSAYRALLDEAIRKFPFHHRFYVNAAIHLMPRWYGGPGELAEFALNSTRPLPDSLADEYYARIVESQADYSRNVFQENAGLSWPRTLHGLRLWRRHWPASTQPASAQAMLACMAGQPGYAREAFSQLRDTLDVEIWGSRERYAWARAVAIRGAPGS